MKCGACKADMGDRFSNNFGWFTFWETDLLDKDDEGPVLVFCTPRCTYEYFRKLYETRETDLAGIEPDLLVIVAQDIFDAIEEASDDLPEPTNDKIQAVYDCWARMGHVLQQLNLTPQLEG